MVPLIVREARNALVIAQRHEVEARVDVEAEEARGRADIPPCDLPSSMIYHTALVEGKSALLNGPVYQGLITRRYKREERVLELTLNRLERVFKEEEKARVYLQLDECNGANSLERYAGLLYYYAVAGYNGTTIEVETSEREARSNAFALEEEADRADIVDVERIEHELADNRERMRLAQHADCLAVVEDLEGCERWNLSELEPGERLEIERAFLRQWRELFARLTWRTVMQEYDARLELERSMHRMHCDLVRPALESIALGRLDFDAYWDFHSAGSAEIPLLSPVRAGAVKSDAADNVVNHAGPECPVLGNDEPAREDNATGPSPTCAQDITADSGDVSHAAPEIHREDAVSLPKASAPVRPVASKASADAAWRRLADEWSA
jgi:hypothetical protein